MINYNEFIEKQNFVTETNYVLSDLMDTIVPDPPAGHYYEYQFNTDGTVFVNVFNSLGEYIDTLEEVYFVKDLDGVVV